MFALFFSKNPFQHNLLIEFFLKERGKLINMLVYITSFLMALFRSFRFGGSVSTFWVLVHTDFESTRKVFT